MGENSNPALPMAPPDAGEDVGSADLVLTDRWLRFYDELIRFEERALAGMQSLASGLSSEVRGRVQQSNLSPIERELQQLRDRQLTWERRRQELEVGRGG